MLEIAKDINQKIDLHGNCISFKRTSSYFIPMHDHIELQIMIPLEGSHYEISWCLKDKDIESKSLGTSDICIIPPFLEHEIRWSHAVNLVNLYIKPDYIDRHVESGFDPQVNILEPQIGIDDQMLFHLAQSFRHYLLTSKNTNHKYIDSLFTVVSQHVVSNYVCLNDSGPAKILFNDYTQIPCAKIREAIIYIQNNLHRTITIEEIADSVEMSHYHFIRTFKEITGMTPAKFHMMQRIEKAKDLLNRKMKIIDIALELGFSSQSHFSNVFSKFVGMTPRKFANN